MLVALLAVTTDEQFGSVKVALEAVDGLSETCHAALEELLRAQLLASQEPPRE